MTNNNTTTVTTAPLSPAQIATMLGLPQPTPEQVAVIAADLTPSVVIAGAGSGKTETMAARVVWLVANGLVPAEQVLGLTFTRKAAGELQQRIRARLRSLSRASGQEYQPLGEPTVLTYAAYAGRLVDEYGLVLGIEPGSRLLTEAMRWQVADSVVRRYDGAFDPDPGVVSTVTERLLDLAGQLADHLVSTDEVRHFDDELVAPLPSLAPKPRARRRWPEPVERFLASCARRNDLLPLVEQFAAAKRGEDCLDFADQMLLAAELATRPPIAESERQRYRVVLLDEYQDTGFAQIEMLAGLFADGRSVIAVGDPLQSIYGWRGASAGNIYRFADRFRCSSGASAPVYSLMTSWRNDRCILAAANTLAEPLRRPGDLPLRERPDAGDGQVTIALTETVEDEARWIASQLQSQWQERAESTPGARTMAVLVRKRSGIGLIAQRLRDVGLPVEVVDLGGLLSLPEIADVRAVLQVLSDHNSGGSLARLLAGARWRISPSDLLALHERAREIARIAETAAGRAHDNDERIDPSLIEALDDLGDRVRYSADGWQRMTDCAAMLRGLRRRVTQPLPDLIAEIETILGIDNEVAVRRSGTGVGRANLDRFIDEAAHFAATRTGSGLSAFLGYLKAAENEEYGLKPATGQVQPERVQVLTVHGAKGLEWDVVAVAGAVTGGFPDQPKSHDWASTPALLPAALRGDRAELPSLHFDGCEHLGDAEDRLTQHRASVTELHLIEERRLAYVALTRAKQSLFMSGAVWGTGTQPRSASTFLTELRELGESEPGTVQVTQWYEVADAATNPLLTDRVGVTWPTDPLGARRASVEHAAALVRHAMAGPQQESLPLALTPRATQWSRDVDVLLAERAAAVSGATVSVDLPAHLSVSDVVMIAGDSAGLARRLRRPMPARPARAARRGTAFHEWLEGRWHADTLLDIDDLPGAVDDTIDDADLESLKAKFERSDWADRTPIAVEVPFEMVFGGRVVRGRMDAVFAEPDGRFTVVDWKTGAPPSGADADQKAIQLAVYRLAWAQLNHLDDAELHRVAAAFYYVGSGLTVAPANLLTLQELRELINGSSGHPVINGSSGRRPVAPVPSASS